MVTQALPGVTLPDGTSLTPTTHPDGPEGVLIRESAGLATVFVPDFPALIEAWQELLARGGAS